MVRLPAAAAPQQKYYGVLAPITRLRNSLQIKRNKESGGGSFLCRVSRTDSGLLHGYVSRLLKFALSSPMPGSSSDERIDRQNVVKPRMGKPW
jgi:hypothetical protein